MVPGRVIGILGGMGPEATLDLYRQILCLTPADRDQDHVPVLIYSNPKIPDRTLALTRGGESPLPYLVDAAKILEEGGAGIIAMPCNAAHHYLAEIRREISIPFLDMVEETCLVLRRRLPRAKTAGLIATLGTLGSRVYERALLKEGIRMLAPDEAGQQRIEWGIARVKAGDCGRPTQEAFQSVGERLAGAGADAVILGCTEVPLAFDPEEVRYPVLNTTRILAEAAVAWALAKEPWITPRQSRR